MKKGSNGHVEAAGCYRDPVKTVEFHLGHIFAKLGIRSRNDLTARIGASAERNP